MTPWPSNYEYAGDEMISTDIELFTPRLCLSPTIEIESLDTFDVLVSSDRLTSSTQSLPSGTEIDDYSKSIIR